MRNICVITFTVYRWNTNHCFPDRHIELHLDLSRTIFMFLSVYIYFVYLQLPYTRYILFVFQSLSVEVFLKCLLITYILYCRTECISEQVVYYVLLCNIIYYYLIVKFYMFYKIFFIFNYFNGFDFLVFYCLVIYCLVF